MLRLGERRGRMGMIRKIRDGISRKIYEEKHSNTALEEGKRRDCLGVERKSPNTD